ncbi:hypothetical protein C6W96_01410 [Streptomyces sp. CS149]|nr:hypothetical protein C6W96_01410 [Streptomyces sp. CS149]
MSQWRGLHAAAPQGENHAVPELHQNMILPVGNDDVLRATENETVLDAAKKMKDLGVGALPICGADNRLKGATGRFRLPCFHLRAFLRRCPALVAAPLFRLLSEYLEGGHRSSA